MTQKAMLEAVRKAEDNGESLNMWQAVEWMYSYGLMTYKEYTFFIKAQVQERKNREKA